MSYSTSNIDTAAFLLTRGHKLLRTHSAAGRVQFEFEDLHNQTAERSVFEFASGGPVNGKLLLQNLSFIRDLMKDAFRTNDRSNEGSHVGRPTRNR